ncbi:FtsK/SpoIIIE family DNA translocase [Limnochorda pilosa]|uniref:Cell division protein FtsK n=1 Tax=Limnochorda pilosa TaxID=1555112 RepID=A0A0K2SLJ9_LIMPI|nr:DNA translocase FtsK [Limnochorda pilosa]BAS27694.1 cell division protein FtsK [Limnochorda pilosa]
MSLGFEPSDGSPGRGRAILAILLITAATLAWVSLHARAGTLGAWLALELRELFGRTADLPPFFLLWAGLRLAAGSLDARWWRRSFGAALLLAVILLGFEMFAVLPLPAANRAELALGFWSSQAGRVGGWLARQVVDLFGFAGGVVVGVAVAVTGLVLALEPAAWRRAGHGAARGAGAVVGLGVAVVQRVAEGVDAVRRLFRWRQVRPRGKAHREAGRRALPAPARPAAPPEARRPERPGPAGPRAGEAAGNVTERQSLLPSAAAAREEAEADDGYGAETPTRIAPRPGGTRSQARSAVRGAQPGYRLPDTSLLRRNRGRRPAADEPDRTSVLEETLKSFGIEGRVVEVTRGPVITRYEVQPPPGIKVSRIVGLADDIALALAAVDVRIEAPVPGKSVVGIEVPNRTVQPVVLRDVIESDAFRQSRSPLAVALGLDITGKPVVTELPKLVHLLIAGATGSGKSVCLNALLVSLLFRTQPDEVRLLLIDPKRVELSVYEGIPHLAAPVVTDAREAAKALRWAVKEMERRYQLFAQMGTRNIDGYNRLLPDEALPYLVVVIDELSDLMLVAAADVEDAIARLAQMARAAGIFLVIATQRPSVDVITGLIKANVPSRLSFAVSSQVDSRTILDMAGAERLLGKGDMLFHPVGAAKPIRAQGALITEREVNEIVHFWTSQVEGEPEYLAEGFGDEAGGDEWDADADDELFEDAVQLVLDTGQASISMLQRRFRVGYSRAARLIDLMERRGIVGPSQGSKPREVHAGRAREFMGDSQPAP